MSEPDEQPFIPSSQKDAVRFVEALADEQDYWLSLTDAARITRTSEAMARRWVSSGRLPVKKEPVGINQRTRLVRASDVARLRPIVDSTAAITDEIHKLDLLSIPRQQAQILQEHQRLLAFVQEGRQRIEEHINHTRLALEQGAAELQQQAQKWDQRFTLQQTAWQQAINLQQQRYETLNTQFDHWNHQTEQRTKHLEEKGKQQQQALGTMANQLERVQFTAQETFQEIQRYLDRLDQSLHQQGDQISRELTTQIQLQEDRFQEAQGKTEETLASSVLAQKRMQDDLRDLQQRLATQQETLMTSIEQQGNEVKQSLEQRWSELEQKKDAHGETLEQRLEAVVAQERATRKICLAHQERVQLQEQQIQALTVQLQEEQAARQALTAQFTQQQEQFQALSRAFASLQNKPNETKE